MSTVNVVKYFFNVANKPKDPEKIKNLCRLAYQTARDREIFIKEVYIRSNVHNTTTIGGKRQRDPKGEHVTFSYKTEDTDGRDMHVACHGYVKDITTLEFKESTHASEKLDSTLKANGKPVWPDLSYLWEAPETYYAHLAETEGKK